MEYADKQSTKKRSGRNFIFDFPSAVVFLIGVSCTFSSVQEPLLHEGRLVPLYLAVNKKRQSSSNRTQLAKPRSQTKTEKKCGSQRKGCDSVGFTSPAKDGLVCFFFFFVFHADQLSSKPISKPETEQKKLYF